jgi:hypothetical protein
MSISWTVLDKPVSVHVKEYQEIFYRIGKDNALTDKDRLYFIGLQDKGSREREVGAPQVGKDIAAGEWLFERFDKGAFGPDITWDEIKIKYQGLYIATLAPDGDWKSLFQTFNQDPFTFDCSVLLGNTILDDDILLPFINNLYPQQAKDAALLIRIEVKRIITNGGFKDELNIMNKFLLDEEDELLWEEAALCPFIAAYRWLSFWGEREFYLMLNN